MLVIKKPFPYHKYESQILESYFENCRIAAIDIETTGLSADRSRVFLVGVLAFEDDGIFITQFFSESLSEEKELLTLFFQFIDSFDVLLNYNGSSFDFPFLNKRAAALRLSKRVPNYKSFDLYRIIKGTYLKDILPDLKLKTVEQFLGVQRKDQISGKEGIALYFQYLTEKDTLLQEQILLHNFEDLASFPALYRIFSKIDIHHVMCVHGFPVSLDEDILYVDQVRISRNKITAEGWIPAAVMDHVHYGLDFSFFIVLPEKRFVLEISVDLKNSLTNHREIAALIRSYLKKVNLQFSSAHSGT